VWQIGESKQDQWEKGANPSFVQCAWLENKDAKQRLKAKLRTAGPIQSRLSGVQQWLGIGHYLKVNVVTLDCGHLGLMPEVPEWKGSVEFCVDITTGSLMSLALGQAFIWGYIREHLGSLGCELAQPANNMHGQVARYTNYQCHQIKFRRSPSRIPSECEMTGFIHGHLFSEG